MQAELASRYPNSVQRIVTNSIHARQLDMPAEVVEAIRQVVEAARTQRGRAAIPKPRRRRQGNQRQRNEDWKTVVPFPCRSFPC
jgi:hypothetical protein